MASLPHEPWPSTLGLTVYNALSLTGRDMTVPELLVFLRAAWDPQYSVEHIERGIEFLRERGFVTAELGGHVKPADRGASGSARSLIRCCDDAELTYGSGYGVS